MPASLTVYWEKLYPNLLSGTIRPAGTNPRKASSDIYSKENLMIRQSFLVLLIFSLLASCAPLLPAGEQLPDLEGTWTITLAQSGGFAGVQRTLTITSDGNVLALDGRAGNAGTFQLSEPELAELKLLVSDAALVGPTGTDTGCADCFIYDLKIETASGNFTVALDDVNLADSGMQPVITYLLDLMEKALSAA
jgi:hypothetical protein